MPSRVSAKLVKIYVIFHAIIYLSPRHDVSRNGFGRPYHRERRWFQEIAPKRKMV